MLTILLFTAITLFWQQSEQDSRSINQPVFLALNFNIEG